jgi:hypothetical protein
MPADAAAGDRLVHPGAAALGFARVEVEVELADQLPARSMRKKRTSGCQTGARRA